MDELKQFDLWSLGMTIYVAMHGSFPFNAHGKKAPEIRRMIVARFNNPTMQIPNPPSNFLNGVSSDQRNRVDYRHYLKYNGGDNNLSRRIPPKIPFLPQQTQQQTKQQEDDLLLSSQQQTKQQENDVDAFLPAPAPKPLFDYVNLDLSRKDLMDRLENCYQKGSILPHCTTIVRNLLGFPTSIFGSKRLTKQIILEKFPMWSFINAIPEDPIPYHVLAAKLHETYLKELEAAKHETYLKESIQEMLNPVTTSYIRKLNSKLKHQSESNKIISLKELLVQLSRSMNYDSPKYAMFSSKCMETFPSKSDFFFEDHTLTMEDMLKMIYKSKLLLIYYLSFLMMYTVFTEWEKTHPNDYVFWLNHKTIAHGMEITPLIIYLLDYFFYLIFIFKMDRLSHDTKTGLTFQMIWESSDTDDINPITISTKLRILDCVCHPFWDTELTRENKFLEDTVIKFLQKEVRHDWDDLQLPEYAINQLIERFKKMDYSDQEIIEIQQKLASNASS